MIAEYRTDHDCRRIIVVTGPTVDVHDVLKVIRFQEMLGLWNYDTLYDQRDTRSVLEPDDLRTIIARIRAVSCGHGQQGRVAIVPPPELHDGIAHSYAALAEDAGVECHVFRTIGGAEAWLDHR